MAYSSGRTVWRMGEGLTISHKKFYMVQNVLSALDLDRPLEQHTWVRIGTSGRLL